MTAASTSPASRTSSVPRSTRPIAFFLPSVRAGGAQRVMVNLAQGMTERGIPVDIVLAVAEGAFLPELPPAARLVDLRAGRLVRSLRPLTRYLRDTRPKVLVSSISHANLIALWSARVARRGTPVIVTEHTTASLANVPGLRLAERLGPALIRVFYPWAASVVAVSRGAADDLARTTGLDRRRMQVVYNPVITTRVLALARQSPDHPWFRPGQPPVITGVGRLSEAKDFPTLLRAFAILRRRRAARLIILGEGEDRRALEGLISELGIGSDVALPGFRDDAVSYMARSALFVLSSKWEGLPTVLIEAMAAGTRVVSTDCPSGPREILQDGRLGALVPVGDADALAQAMFTALAQPVPPLPADALAPFTPDAAVNHYLRLIEAVQ
ncbi:MAG: glycosyltransferase [Gemmatimonadales bacterium]|jgi:glycosyltransferase involved in cell wall biosynthesis